MLIYVAEKIQTRFNTSNYELEKPLPQRKNKNKYCLSKK